MSADNGIYILQTINPLGGKEYRVSDLSAIENLNYDKDAPDPIIFQPSKEDYSDKQFHSVNEYMPENTKHLEWSMAYRAKYHSDDDDVLIRNARKIFARCQVRYTREDALKEADIIYQNIMASDFPVLEYGISFITIDRVF